VDADAESSSQRIEPAAPAPPEREHLDGSRARRSRHRGIIVTLVVSFLLLLAPAAVLRVASGDGNDGEDGGLTYRAYGVLFHYPSGWSRWAGSVDVGSSEVLEFADADALWSTVVGPDSGPIVGGFVSVGAYRLDSPITAQSMDADLPAVVSNVLQDAEQNGLVVQGDPEQLTMAGLPGVRFRVTGTVEGPRSRARRSSRSTVRPSTSSTACRRRRPRRSSAAATRSSVRSRWTNPEPRLRVGTCLPAWTTATAPAPRIRASD
jgi:hypothetical protein